METQHAVGMYFWSTFNTDHMKRREPKYCKTVQLVLYHVQYEESKLF